MENLELLVGFAHTGEYPSKSAKGKLIVSSRSFFEMILFLKK